MPLIVPYQEEDCGEILNIYTPFVRDSAVSFEAEVPELIEFQNRLDAIAFRFPLMVLKENNSILGYAYANTHRERLAYRWAVETSIYLHEKARGRGLGKILYNHILNELEKRGFTHAFGIITLPNDASAALHSACGFRNLAIHEKAGWKMGKWHDVLWMRKDLAAPSPTPFEPEFNSWNGQISL